MTSLLGLLALAVIVLYVLTRISSGPDLGKVSEKWLNQHRGSEGSQDYWVSQRGR